MTTEDARDVGRRVAKEAADWVASHPVSRPRVTGTGDAPIDITDRSETMMDAAAELRGRWDERDARYRKHTVQLEPAVVKIVRDYRAAEARDIAAPIMVAEALAWDPPRGKA